MKPNLDLCMLVSLIYRHMYTQWHCT